MIPPRAETAAVLPRTPRALCERCRRPVRVCVCALLPALSPRTRVLILQHPRESRVAIGTARMASRCLRGSSVVVGTHLEAHRDVARALLDPERRAVLLWPGPDALDLEVAPPRGPLSLLVVDGTWSTAKKLLRMNPAIAALPRYAIAPKSPSEYRIRREPRAECLSTIEALAAALGVLEGEPERYRAMLEPFRAMVNAQIDHLARGPCPRDKSRLARKRRKAWEPPPALRDPRHVVVVAIETNGWPASEKRLHPDEIVHVIAARGDGSERLEAIVRPTHPLAPSVSSHTGLDPALLLAGSSLEESCAAARAFLGEGDVLATWGTYATDLLRDAGLADGREAVNLRRVAADWLRASPGSMERFAERLSLAPRVLGRGRAGRRLGLMVAVLGAVRHPAPRGRAPR